MATSSMLISVEDLVGHLSNLATDPALGLKMERLAESAPEGYRRAGFKRARPSLCRNVDTERTQL